MPFFRPNDHGIECLLCTAPAGSQTWKLHAQVNGELCRGPTGFPADVVECAPMFWQDDAGLHISLIAGMGIESGQVLYRMYLLHAADQAELLAGPRVEDTGLAGFTGFVNALGRGYLRPFADRTELVIEHDHGVHELVASGRFVYRLSYCLDEPAMILVSGGGIDGEDEFSLIYHLETGEQRELICDGVPGYKAALCGGEMQYALRCGQGFEDREVRMAEFCGFRPCAILEPVNRQALSAGLLFS